MKQVTAQLNYAHIAPRKMRLLGDALKRLPVIEAEAQLLHRPQRSALPLLKLLRSAVANAKNNLHIAPEQLRVVNVIVNKGPMLRRSLPRAQGRATEIQKKMSHVTITLEEMPTAVASRFVIVPPEKEEKKTESKKQKSDVKNAKKQVNPEKMRVEEKQAKPEEKGGMLKRVFRRKTGE